MYTTAAAAKSLQSCPTLRPHRWQPTRLLHPWDSRGKNTRVGCLLTGSHLILNTLKKIYLCIFFFLLTFCVFSVTFYIFMLIISLFLVIIVNFSIVCLLIFVLTYLSGLSFAFTIYSVSRDSFPLLYILFVRAFCLFVCFFHLKKTL